MSYGNDSEAMGEAIIEQMEREQVELESHYGPGPEWVETHGWKTLVIGAFTATVHGNQWSVQRTTDGDVFIPWILCPPKSDILRLAFVVTQALAIANDGRKGI